jgi:cytochrome c-type biogenesis protein CcmH/NrfG
MMLGLAYGYTGALKQAEDSFKRAYRLGGEETAEAHLYLAGIYNKQGRYAEAVKELEGYLKEADGKNVDRSRVREMIDKLKAKERGSK